MNAAQPDPAPEVPATRWDAVGALFTALLDLDAEARAARLAAADPDVAREVASLLNAHDAAADAPLPPLPFPESPARDELGPGDAVGPYVLLEEVGRGGMGTVYRARRADGAFERTVALKIVSRGRDTDLILRRFARERAVLAGLTHPNVARLYDGGSAPDGRPYLAMEFVVGAPITGVCDARRMPVPERLRLFLQVCEAVAYAHRNLVVHRDLKPSNVFVADAGDGGLTVKLLDFGL
ncbi:MAG TPA: serine/threonine-protein kinase, partial [Rhodothermales bacterium]|nr:serine/threonine-protein kinase [Rhodothermales bacterium]